MEKVRHGGPMDQGRRSGLIGLLIGVLVVLVFGAILVGIISTIRDKPNSNSGTPAAEISLSATGPNPTSITVSRNSSVSFTNNDTVEHRISQTTSAGLPEMAVTRIQPGETSRQTVRSSGSIVDQTDTQTFQIAVTVQ